MKPLNTIILLGGVTILAGSGAWAVEDVKFDPYSVDDSAIEAEKASCDDFCTSIKPAWSESWSRQDDQWCANHGSPTNNTIPPASHLVPAQSAQCPYPVLAGESCSGVKKKLWNCKWRNSQAAKHCMAYGSMEFASQGQKNVMYFDVVAAGTCGAVCTSLIGNGTPAALACSAAGTAATLAELTQVFKYRGFAQLAGLAGLGAGATGAALNGVAAAVDIGQLSSGEDIQLAQQKAKKAACLSAVSFAALAGLRGLHIHSTNKSKREECAKVDQLVSAAVSVQSGGPGGAPGSGDPLSQRYLGGGFNSNGAGTQNSNLAADFSEPKPGLNPDGTLDSQAATAADGQMLSHSGLDRMLSPKLTDDLKAQWSSAAEKGNLGAAIAGSIGGDLGKALGAIAHEAAQNPGALAHLVPMTGVSGSAYAGGGGGSSSGGAAPSVGFDKLFGAKEASLGAGGNRNLAFETHEDPDDIWHTGTDKNIFQIVSGRIERVTPRLAPRR